MPYDISFKLFGKITLSRLLHPANAYAFTEVTPSPISTPLKFLQFPYLQPIITQYFIDNKSEIWLLFLIAHSKR